MELYTGSRTVSAMTPAMLKPSNTGKRLRLARCTGLASNKVFHLPLTQRRPPTKARARGTSPSKMSPAAENIVTRESEGFLPGKVLLRDTTNSSVATSLRWHRGRKGNRAQYQTTSRCKASTKKNAVYRGRASAGRRL